MRDARVFKTLARCFEPVDEPSWRATTNGTAWGAFADDVRRLLQDGDALGGDRAPIAYARRHAPLDDFLSDCEVRALFAAPSYAGKTGFAARCFTGGLPCSAVPVESLYADWSPREKTEGCTRSAAGMFAGARGLYRSDVSLYMDALASSLGVDTAQRFSLQPDHIAVELEVMALLLEQEQIENAHRFLIERFEWLTAYRKRLVSRCVDDPEGTTTAVRDTAAFYLALIDVILGIRARCEERAATGALAATGR